MAKFAHRKSRERGRFGRSGQAVAGRGSTTHAPHWLPRHIDTRMAKNKETNNSSALGFEAELFNERESRSLAQLRDTLLPKLISGELRVADTGKFLESAT